MSDPRGAPAAPPAKPTQVWTVLELLRWTTEHFAKRGIDSARLDAECLLAHALGTDRLRLYLDFEKPVLEEERARFRDLVRRRGADRVPVAQLVGEKEFWSLSLRITPDVLVPRPETETLVSAALDLLTDLEAPVRVLELGTGSGAVALALARERPAATITATDISGEALKLAQENAETHAMTGRIRFLEGDGLEAVGGETFDLIVSNPPYVAETARERLAPELAHEPPGALFAGPDGFDVLDRWIGQAPGAIVPGGALVLEHGAEQSDRVVARCTAAGFIQVVTHRDLGGRLRVVSARLPGGGEATGVNPRGPAGQVGGAGEGGS